MGQSSLQINSDAEHKTKRYERSQLFFYQLSRLTKFDVVRARLSEEINKIDQTRLSPLRLYHTWNIRGAA